jgi:MFS family permease
LANLVMPNAGHLTAMLLVFAFGGMSFAIYPIAVAHLVDYLRRDELLSGSSTVLLVNGIGSSVGPLLAGTLMSLSRPEFLFRREYASTVATVPAVTSEPSSEDAAHNLARMQELAGEFAATLDAGQRELILSLPERTPLPHELDRELLLRASELLGRKLEETEKRTLRGALRSVVTAAAPTTEA